MIIRVSIGFFDPSKSDNIEQAMRDSEAVLRPAISRLEGNLAYFVTIDKEKGCVTNISHWTTIEAAKQMSSLAEMLAQRPILEGKGVQFQQITNHEILWEI
jgi:hypothetical protein